jgi:glutathione peroxidase
VTKQVNLQFLSKRSKWLLLLVVAIALLVYLFSGSMTVRQKILKAVYPLFMLVQKKAASGLHNQSAAPLVPFYSLQYELNNGSSFLFEQLKGKKVLLVNTASDCGYTGQYEQLQELYQRYQGQLVILGFPANDFKEQEKGSDEEIATFCKINYGVTFPLMKKSSVVKGASQNPVFRWLSDASLNGWNKQAPKWNFSKYLVNEKGVLTHYFDPGVSPVSQQVTDAIEQPSE